MSLMSLDDFCPAPVELLMIKPELTSKFKKENNLKLIIDASNDRHKELCRFAAQHIKLEKSRQAYIKMFYLYYFLIHSADMGDSIYVIDICQALNISKSTHSQLYKLLAIQYNFARDESKHNKSVYEIFVQKSDGTKDNAKQKKLETFKNYRVPVLEAKSAGPNTKTTIYNYNLSKELYNRLHSEGFQFYKRRYYNLRVNELTQLQEFLHIEGKESKVNQQEINKITLKKQDVFLPDYPCLDFENLTVGKAIELSCFSDVINFYRNKNCPIKFSSGRIYHVFHRLSKSARKYLAFEGSKLVEAMDVHNCFFVLMTKIFELVEQTDKEEVRRWADLVKKGRLYEDIASWTKLPREIVKKTLQSYRNSNTYGMGASPVDNYFKCKFPTIRNFLTTYPTYKNEDGRKVKWMQIDISCIETYIMSQICWDLHKLGYHPFTLHDAIYLSETENRKVTEAGIRVEDLFWRYFESLTTDDLAEILREVRNEKNAKLAAEEETKSAKNSKKSQKTCTPLPCDSQNSASK